jgi:hypothetical protein
MIHEDATGRCRGTCGHALFGVSTGKHHICTTSLLARSRGEHICELKFLGRAFAVIVNTWGMASADANVLFFF